MLYQENWHFQQTESLFLLIEINFRFVENVIFFYYLVQPVDLKKSN